jgi:DNA-binding transcriptional ArsR family regulator
MPLPPDSISTTIEMNDAPSSFISTMVETELTEVLQALGDPVRLAVVRELAAGPEPRACGTFAHLGVSPSTLSHHLRVLRDAGVVETRAEGHQRLNRLARERLDARFPGLLASVLAATAPARSSATDDVPGGAVRPSAPAAHDDAETAQAARR